MMGKLPPWTVATLLVVAANLNAIADDPRPVDFNRDVRPILSNKCFLCHGPDEADRKADLRLDTREGAIADLGGYAAVVPGDVDSSELVARLVPDDPAQLMPPKKSGKSLTPQEIDTLRRWVAEGAPYARHWAYEKPTRLAPPEVRDPAWSQGPIDRFLLARMEKEGLKPLGQADRLTLARRVAIDLTGLPPSIEEADAFLHDPAPNAYERYVDRQLAKPAYGEHWARLWLDLARYADSAGYADDPPRTIWAYRDWVIRAYNQNMPFDQFTIAQLAGDLLPSPTDDQLIATAFHRNTMTNSEGGTNDEEFRNVAVVDRVNTTWTVWMGTSMACAQCHNHKYDPFSQRNYFESFAILNNTEDDDRRDEAPVLPLESDEQKQRRQAIAAELASLDVVLKTPTPELEAGQTRWEAGFPAEPVWNAARPTAVASREGTDLAIRDDGSILASQGKKVDVYTVTMPAPEGPLSALRLEALTDDGLPSHGPGLASNGNFVISRIRASLQPTDTTVPTGRYVRIVLPGDRKFLSLAEVQVFHGNENIATQGDASQISTGFDGPARLAIDGKTDGDYQQARSTTHTAQASDPWWELDLKESRPMDRIVVWNRTDGTTGDRLKGARVQVLDDNRQPVWETILDQAPKPSAELPLSNAKPIVFDRAYADFEQANFPASSVLNGSVDAGWAIGGAIGQSHSLSLVPREPISVPPRSNLVVTIEQDSKHANHTLGRFRLATTGSSRAADLLGTPARVLAAIRKAAEDRSADERALIDAHYRSIAPELKEARDRKSRLETELAGLKPYTSVPICRELPQDRHRVTKVQLRGNYLELGEVVHEGTPESLPPLPQGVAANRLGLARWLVSADNPLTARVIANRYWEQIFGIGLVRTSEEFGAQGELPSHPELLDWLACELVETGWDLKAFLKQLVMTSAYRQSSAVTPDLLEADPDNRLLARGPRFRASAEVVRDQALAASGLLSTKLYGPPVNPPRPATGLNAAFGSAIDKATSKGEDRYRRALYTEWRRSNPYPSMTTFDAPNRDVCMVRRSRTNTPLQALVTLNDPVYIEAAQALARRIIAGGSTPEDRARLGVRLALTRNANDAEVQRLIALHDQARERYSHDQSRARALAADASGTDADEQAAWTLVANVLLNLDEIFLKR